MTNYSQLLTLLEFLNICGSSKQKEEATKLSNVVVTQIQSYSGKVLGVPQIIISQAPNIPKKKFSTRNEPMDILF